MRRTEFTNGNVYYLANYGVESRALFTDDEDRVRFLECIRRFRQTKEKPYLDQLPELNLTMLAYSLCGSGFHFMVRQEREEGITEMMHQLGTAYSMFFNKKYRRMGRLFVGPFKAKTLTTDEQFLAISKYIHRCALRLLPSRDPAEQVKHLRTYLWSSYQDYVGLREGTLADRKFVLSTVQAADAASWYKKFVEAGYTADEREFVEPFVFEPVI